MPESRTESALASWSVAQCPFTIEYSPRVMDEIRLAVVDAFYSLPRGGAEIGGILLGRLESRRLIISDFRALECEHATGPSFVLSPRDQTRLAELLASARGKQNPTQPVGWYHSHTRSDIFLSPADLDIHQRFFPEPWQVALVLKPHTFQPTRAGFFFHESSGSMRATASYQEFALEPLTAKPHPSPSADPAPSHSTAAALRRVSDQLAPVIPIVAEPPPEPRPSIPRLETAPAAPAVEPEPPALEPEPEPLTERELAPPRFTQVEPVRSWRWLKRAAVVAAMVVIGPLVFETRNYWLAPLMNRTASAPAAQKPLYIGLSTLDADGQLQIRWDRDAPAVRNANGGTLVIEDGGPPRVVTIDPAHLRTGSFTYGRQSERVDVAVTLHTPDGQSVREVTTYLGKLPNRQPPPEDPGTRKDRDALAKQLESQKAQTKRLQKSVEDMHAEMKREQQRKRLEKQSPDTVK